MFGTMDRGVTDP